MPGGACCRTRELTAPPRPSPRIPQECTKTCHGRIGLSRSLFSSAIAASKSSSVSTTPPSLSHGVRIMIVIVGRWVNSLQISSNRSATSSRRFCSLSIRSHPTLKRVRPVVSGGEETSSPASAFRVTASPSLLSDHGFVLARLPAAVGIATRTGSYFAIRLYDESVIRANETVCHSQSPVSLLSSSGRSIAATTG